MNEDDGEDDDDWDCGSEVRKLLSMCTGRRYAVLAPSTIPSWPALSLLLPLSAQCPCKTCCSALSIALVANIRCNAITGPSEVNCNVATTPLTLSILCTCNVQCIVCTVQSSCIFILGSVLQYSLCTLFSLFLHQ